MLETIISMSFPNGDDTSNDRDMVILIRTGAAETHSYSFNQYGVLAEIAPKIIEYDPDDINNWVFAQATWFTREDVEKSTGRSRNTVQKRLNQQVDAKHLLKELNGKGNEFRYHVAANAQPTQPKQGGCNDHGN
jgi:hypothetical protein